MMACGLPIVDLDRPGNEVNYSGRKDIAVLAGPSPTALGQSIAQLVGDSTELDCRRQNGLEFAATFPSEDEMAKRVEELIVRRLARSETARQDTAALFERDGRLAARRAMR
jgi:hypothetical protein